MSLALRAGADAICERPLVLNPTETNELAILERETGQRVYTIQKLRLPPRSSPRMIRWRRHLWIKTGTWTLVTSPLAARGATPYGRHRSCLCWQKPRLMRIACWVRTLWPKPCLAGVRQFFAKIRAETCNLDPASLSRCIVAVRDAKCDHCFGFVRLARRIACDHRDCVGE